MPKRPIRRSNDRQRAAAAAVDRRVPFWSDFLQSQRVRGSTLLMSAPAASVSSLLLERRLRRARVETVHPNHSGALNGGERAQTLLGRHFDRGFRSRGQVEVVCAGHVEHACHGTECKLCPQVLKPMTPCRQRRGDGLRHTSDTSLELATSLLYLAARPAARRLKTTTTALMLSSS